MTPHDGQQKIALGGEIFRLQASGLPWPLLPGSRQETHTDAHTDAKPFTPVIQMKQENKERHMLQGPFMSRWTEVLSVFHFQMAAPDRRQAEGQDRADLTVDLADTVPYGLQRRFSTAGS